MEKKSHFSSANWIMGMGVLAVLIAAQWKNTVVPTSALALVVLLTIAKSRLIILDFIGLRGGSLFLTLPLYAFVLTLGLAQLACRMVLG